MNIIFSERFFSPQNEKWGENSGILNTRPSGCAHFLMKENIVFQNEICWLIGKYTMSAAIDNRGDNMLLFV